MEFTEFTTDLLARLKQLSDEFGTGDLNTDIGFFLFVLVILFVLIGAFAFIRSRRRPNPLQGFERLTGVAGRLEKFEMSVNSFRTETCRSIEFLRDRVTQLEHEVAALKGEIDELEVEEVFPEKQETVEEEEHKVESEESLEESEAEPATEEEPAAAATEPESLSKRLHKTRFGLFEKLKEVFSSKSKLDEETLDELQALLVGSDLGMGMTNALIEDVKKEMSAGVKVNQGMLLSMLEAKILSILEHEAPSDASILPEKKDGQTQVVMMVGVNGVGKTTTVAKLASSWKAKGAKVMMVAADTFRAAAVQQLSEWGKRIDVPVITGAENAKPATVVYDAMEKAKAEDVDIVIIDTAGRLHTKSNLMQELEGVRNVIQKHQADAPHETILVVDGTTGQNAVSQAKEFNEAVKLTGLIITKLDGTPKGGIVVAIKNSLGIPVRYIGVGEATEDLRPFIAADFVQALFDTSELNSRPRRLTSHGIRRRERRNTQGFSL